MNITRHVFVSPSEETLTMLSKKVIKDQEGQKAFVFEGVHGQGVLVYSNSRRNPSFALDNSRKLIHIPSKLLAEVSKMNPDTVLAFDEDTNSFIQTNNPF